MEVWSGRVAHDYDLLRAFKCPAYYHVKKDKLGPRARKGLFIGYKKDVKGNKIWYLKNKKFTLSKDVTFDEASMMKPTSSQQVESETTDRISQQVESDAISQSLERSVSLEIILVVTQDDDHVANQDANDDEDQGRPMGEVHNPLQLKEPEKIHICSVGSLLT